MQNQHDTQDEDTSFAPICGPLEASREPVWITAVVVVAIMFVVGLSLLRLAGLVP